MDKYLLKFIWFKNKSIAVSLDLKILDKTVPLTEYFFWPKSDAWEDMRVCLESIDWINSTDIVKILNQLTEVINYWQDTNVSQSNLDCDSIKQKFPACKFVFLD